MRSQDVADGQQVEIPVLSGDRTVGTHVESITGEWTPGQAEELLCRKNRTVRQSCDADRNLVGKYVSHVTRKAAIVCQTPVP